MRYVNVHVVIRLPEARKPMSVETPSAPADSSPHIAPGSAGRSLKLGAADIQDLESFEAGRGALPARAYLQSDAPRLSLNGEWQFRLSPGSRVAPDDGWQLGEALNGFESLPVPSSWPMHGHGAPAYTNVQFPFAVEPPHVPEANPIGDHLVVFEAGPEFFPHALLRFGPLTTGEVERLLASDHPELRSLGVRIAAGAGIGQMPTPRPMPEPRPEP